MRARAAGRRRKRRSAWQAISAPVVRVANYLVDRCTEASSIAAITAGGLNYLMAVSYDAAAYGYFCLVLAAVQVLMPDGLIGFRRDRRRPRKRPAAKRA